MLEQRVDVLGNSSRDYLITGIPRSGTSLLCRLLDDQPDSVVINEPHDIFAILSSPSKFEELPAFYNKLRRKINEKKPVRNKIRNGKVINDTALGDKRSRYVPEVKSSSFLLGTKNTVAYLGRLEVLRQFMPKSKILACVREPRATLASWKKSFPHLQKGLVEAFPIGGLNDTLLSASQRNELRRIAECEDLYVKRALFWRYLATRLLENRGYVEIIHYETLIRTPYDLLRQIMTSLSPEAAPEIVQSDVVIRPNSGGRISDPRELQIIADICGPAAEEWGYRI